ncbi:bifunctional nuclease 1-like protein [Trifolium pratense]|uniref:Bifunctional nuclease 1-like protein n=1 Tax=Trifolium pratense TaxID=57577 RepID=A0A2K3MV79_TRIPR|nr:bifunctional nuclease 1-like protein [Trifolium pratense]
MGSLQGQVMCPSVHPKVAGFCSLPMIGPMNASCVRPEFWGLKELSGSGKTRTGFLSWHINTRKSKTIVHCSLNPSSNDGGSTAENFDEKDEDYVRSSVIEAVEVKSGADGFIIKMRDGKHLRCVQNNPQGGHLPDYSPHPAIVLKMEDGLLLPIIVSEMPSVLLMAAVRNVQIARPTLYEVVMEMIEKMDYQVRLVRVTRRVDDAYFAQLYLTKAFPLYSFSFPSVGKEAECRSFDLRPSDAINIAIRCKVPIQVNKYLAHSDGMRVIESGKVSIQFPGFDGRLLTEMDKPNGQPCAETDEFNLLNNMLKAVGEERYSDAALWRDKLNQHRAGKNVKKR